MSFVRKYCERKKLPSLWSKLEDVEEDLVLLASEGSTGLWEDICQIWDDLDIEQKHRPYLKIALIKSRKQRKAAEQQPTSTSSLTTAASSAKEEEKEIDEIISAETLATKKDTTTNSGTSSIIHPTIVNESTPKMTLLKTLEEKWSEILEQSNNIKNNHHLFDEHFQSKYDDIVNLNEIPIKRPNMVSPDLLKQGDTVVISKGTSYLFRSTLGKLDLTLLLQSTLFLSSLSDWDVSGLTDLTKESSDRSITSKQTLGNIMTKLCDACNHKVSVTSSPMSFRLAVSDVARDIGACDWSWLLFSGLAHDCGFGPIIRNDLMVCTMDFFSQCRLNGAEEMIVAQSDGYREFVLFPPSDFDALSIEKYPGCKSTLMDWTKHDDLLLSPQRAIIGAGDVLYIPPHWSVEWRCLTPISVSVSFSCESLMNDDRVSLIRAKQKIAHYLSGVGASRSK